MPKSAKAKGKAKVSNPETTTGLIESIVKRRRLKIRPFQYGDYFAPHFSTIREHYLRQGKFRHFVRFVVNLGILARKADAEFLESIKEYKEDTVIRYGEASLSHLNSNAMELEEIYDLSHDQVEFLQENSPATVHVEDVDDLNLEFAVRLLRCNKNYRVCFVPESEFVHSLSIYPFIIEMIYAVAEDLDKDKEFLETMVKLYSLSVIRYHENGNFSAFYQMKHAVVSYLKQKNIQLIFAVCVMDALKRKVEFFNKELTMHDFPDFIDELETGKDFILLD